jgi:hypothetical protein
VRSRRATAAAARITCSGLRCASKTAPMSGDRLVPTHRTASGSDAREEQAGCVVFWNATQSVNWMCLSAMANKLRNGFINWIFDGWTAGYLSMEEIKTTQLSKGEPNHGRRNLRWPRPS